MSTSPAPSRITVTNFDAVRQAQLWVTLGAEAASERLTAMLRTAVLIGGRVVLDRNQVLDGIYFLALGPDGVAAALGLGPRDPLPLLLTCRPATPDGPPPDVPRLLGTAGMEPTVSLARQRADVRTEHFLTASSAQQALAGRGGPHPWLVPAPGAAWFPGCGLLDRFHSTDSPATLEQARHAAQERWLDAAAHARVAVDEWGGAMDMPRALARQRAALMECSAGNPDPLAVAVLGLESSLRKDAVEALTGWGSERAVPEEELRLALSLWSRAYYDAIAAKDGSKLISFYDEGLDPDNRAGAGFERARRFGLALPPRPRWRRWLDRHAPASGGLLRVEGEILDHMQVVDPGAFQRLARTSGDSVAAIGRGDRSSMYDLALACRSAVATPPARHRRQWEVGLRMSTMTLMAVAVAVLTLLGEFVTLTTGERVAAVAAAAVLALLASLPWDAIIESYRLRGSAMTATLSVKEQP